MSFSILIACCMQGSKSELERFTSSRKYEKTWGKISYHKTNLHLHLCSHALPRNGVGAISRRGRDKFCSMLARKAPRGVDTVRRFFHPEVCLECTRGYDVLLKMTCVHVFES